MTRGISAGARRPLATRVVIGLTLGLAAGAVISATRNPTLLTLGTRVEPVGTLWVNAILMTVIPLVVSNLIVGVAGTADARVFGQLGWRGLALFIGMVCASAAITALVTPPLLAWLPIDSSSAGSLRAETVSAPVQAIAPPTVGQWFGELVPSNPIKAAAEGTILPLVVFTLALALALTRISPELRQAVVRFFEAVAEAMRVLIEWILMLAPLGVFALALALATRLGIAAVGALGFYVALVVALSALLTLALYLVAAGAGRVSVRRFGRAVAPAQAVAFSARSSLASLPALIHGAEQLDLPLPVIGFVLPVAVSIFRVCFPVTAITGVLFLGRLYGIVVPPGTLVQVMAFAVLVSFAVPGVPGGSLLVIAPIFVAAGLPVQGIGVLLAVDAIPDMVRTPTNVTADLTVATILARHLDRPTVPAAAIPTPA